MVLAQKQTRRSMDRNREPKNGPSTLGQLIFNKAGNNIQWNKQSLQQVVLEKLDSNMQKNEASPLSYTIHKK